MAIRIKPPHSSVRRLNRFPQNTSYQIACHRKDEGGKADNCYWRKNGHERIHAYEGKGDADSQRIDTGGYSQCQYYFKRVGSKQHLSSLLSPSFYHSSSQKAKRPKAIQWS